MPRGRDPHDAPPTPRRREPPPPVPTLGQLQRSTYGKWVWLHCNARACHHSIPVALAPYVIRWGPGASSDKLRRSARCAACGGRGATLIHPSFGDTQIGFMPFPKRGSRQ